MVLNTPVGHTSISFCPKVLLKFVVVQSLLLKMELILVQNTQAFAAIASSLASMLQGGVITHR